MTAALGLLAAMFTLAPAAHAAAVPQELTDAATADPAASFDVLVDSSNDNGSASTATSAVLATIPAAGTSITLEFDVIDGLTAHLSGAQILALSDDARVSSIIPDAEMEPTAYSNPQVWPAVTELNTTWTQSNAPAIAIVDSGIDTTRADFGGTGQIVRQVNFTSSGHNTSNGDGYGHGTFVASIAAGRGRDYAGASPSSRLVSLDVFDDDGNGTIGSVIAAADWIYRNYDKYNIKVANFSLTASTPSSFVNDPLDKAVEALWFNKGIVVVAAAGNYHTPGVDKVLYAPANDPFVITVGAYGDNSSLDPSDDTVADWSARGHTLDGFAKPEIGAPGRNLWGAVPQASTMWTGHNDHQGTSQNGHAGYFWMSGTSFAAPMVSGAAALIRQAHPTWTPDQVKGALMLTAAPNPTPGDFSYGVGALRAAQAAAVVDPPNPNAALWTFVHTTQNAVLRFDRDAWQTAASDASWESASWESASWESASWESASWESASWESASWESASWADGTAPPSDSGVGADAIWIP
jgi:serine protease AprX